MSVTGILALIIKAVPLYIRDGRVLGDAADLLVKDLTELGVLHGDGLTVGEINAKLQEHGVDPSGLHQVLPGDLPGQAPEGSGNIA